MPFFGRINLISVCIIGALLLPPVVGLFRPLTREGISRTFSAALGAVIFVASGAASVAATEALFSNNGDNALAVLFENVPVIRESLATQDILVYGLLIAGLFAALNGLMHLAAMPLVRLVIRPVSRRFAAAVSAAGAAWRRLIWAAWRLPKGICLALSFSLLFSLYAALVGDTPLSAYIDGSRTYRIVEKNAVGPIVSSRLVSKIPDIVDDTVGRAVECLSPEGRRLLIRVYINGVTVDEAVRSSPAIDNVAIDIVGIETDDYRKAWLLYVWITENIAYDTAKADIVKIDPFLVESGAIQAFQTRTGVCFDMACLYTAMCRAAGVGVRLLTGPAYNGSEWLEHSWNQIYDDREDRWVDADPTFGINGSNYFDREGFDDDHGPGEIHGQW